MLIDGRLRLSDLVAPFLGALIGWAFYRVAVTCQIETNLQTD